MPTKQTPTQQIAGAVLSALNDFNKGRNTAWDLGSNWSNVNTDFETFINKFLFPKITETVIISVALGNRFQWLAKEVDFVGQYSEEYVFKDTVPIGMNLSKNEELMLKRNYPEMITKLYGQGIVKKMKFTLNNNDNRLNWLTLADGVSYALSVYKKKISDINVAEEKEVKGMLVDYSLNQLDASNIMKVTSQEEMFDAVFERILNIQNNSEKYNEFMKASNGQSGRYTTVTNMQDVAILTSDKNKRYLLNTKLAQTFQVAGLDVSRRIISFDDLGGVYRAKSDITIENADTIKYLKGYGDYQIEVGDIIPEGNVITFKPELTPELVGKFEEIKPDSEFYCYVFDINKLKYRQHTKGMLKTPFYNGEFDETNYWIHYYSYKRMSPFFNSTLITGA